MITKITGKLLHVDNDWLTIEATPFERQVLIAEFTRRQLQHRVGDTISLHTIEYLEGNPMQGRLTPRLVGFMNEIEREFFEMFCSVDGVGVKKALRAVVRPVAEVADAIEQQDTKQLSTLPGIGPATADRIVAKLRRKMPKFALLVSGDTETERAADIDRDIANETFEVLKQLGHSDSDARHLLDLALSKKKKYKDVQSVINAIYQQSHES